MSHEAVGLHDRENATINAVIAVLAVLTETPMPATISSTEDFRPGHTPAQCAFLIAAAAMQTEVSLPIAYSDRMIREVADGLEVNFGALDEDTKEVLVVVTDDQVHRMVALMQGRGPLVHQIAQMLILREKMPSAEVRSLVLSA